MLTVEFFASRTVFLAIGEFRIYWYGLIYVLAFWTAWYALPILGKMRGVLLTRDQWTNIVAFGALGILVGGRLGYALFYEPLFFLQSPGMRLQIWHGGMSSHGGFIGAALGVWWATKRIPLLSKEGLGEVRDVLTVPAALGLALGRIGNIVNKEFGVYPYYEAVGDMAIALVCYLLIRRSSVPFSPIGENVSPAFVQGADEGNPYSMPPNQPSPSRLRRGALSPIGERGSLFAIFLMLYGAQRFLLEYFRPQEWSLVFGLSRGQIFTIPLFLIAVILLKNAYKQRI